MGSRSGEELTELEARQEPRLVKALEMVAPGTALREGIDNILHARTGGPDRDRRARGAQSFLFSGGIKLDIDYTPALLYQVAKMDGAIILNANATKIAMANVQLMPDPTILSHETGTRHRTAERVSKQTDALVIAISQRREVVSLYVDGAKYILEDIPVVLAKANQALATLDKYRTRLDQVSTRLTALEFEGGATLHDVLTVLQRSELVTRMAVEIERYIVELGTEGRLIEMQLEETMVGAAADKAALVHDYLAEHSDEAFAGVLDQLARLAHQDLLDFGRLAELLGYDRKLNTLDYPVSPRGHRILGRIPRLPKLVGPDRRRVRRPGRAAGRHRRGARGGRGRGRDPGEGHPRGPSPPAGDQPRGPLPADLDMARRGAPQQKEDTIPEASEAQLIEDLEVTREVEHIEFEIGDHVVYPHHGAGKVLKKEEKEILGEKREYLTIKILHNDMTVMVPTENAGKAGLRRVIDEETVKKVLAVLQDEVSEMPKNWNRRFKHNRDKIKTGDIYELAEVVRNLAIREQREGALHRREADVHPRQEDPRVRADVRARDGRGRGRGPPRRPPDAVGERQGRGRRRLGLLRQRSRKWRSR